VGVKDEQRFGSGSRKTVGKKPQRSYGSSSEFINLELDKGQTAEYRTWREGVDDVVLEWARALESGYRLNTKWDDYSSSFAAFLIPDEGGDNGGFILTGRGGTPYRAAAEVLFKHVFVFHGEWSNPGLGRDLRDDPDF